MDLYDLQTIQGSGKALDHKDRQIAALKGVITKLKDKQTTNENCKQLVKDMWNNLYGLYNRDFFDCHGEPREGYEYLPKLLERIENVVSN